MSPTVLRAGAMALAWLTFAVFARGLGSHELLLIVNADSPDSVRVAREYTRLRDIPPSNRIELDLGAHGAPESTRLTPDQFRQHIYEPAVRLSQERGIASHIQAWVYSVGFPYQVTTTPPISLTGMTLVRGRDLTKEEIDRAKYKSPLFAGPDRTGQSAASGLTLEAAAELIGDNMPLPAMMLGYTGEGGNTVEEVLACLERGKQAHATRPEGTVYFLTGNDIRMKCRQWQFPQAAQSLQLKGVDAVVTNALPMTDPRVLGIMAGKANISCPPGIKFLPGAMAEHLTSFAGAFDSPTQTKLSMWIQAGAAASSGAVSEPYSAWLKFPNAWFYVHYASGCTMLESFYLSIRSPLQILLVGDPLACPWANSGTLHVTGIPEGPVSGVLTFGVSVDDADGTAFSQAALLVDDRMVDRRRKAPLVLDTSALTPGPHRLRIVASELGNIRNQLHENFTITVKTHDENNSIPDGMATDTYEELKGLLNPE